MRCSLRHFRLEKRNEPVLIVFMSKVVHDGICEASHTWEDGELSWGQCSSSVRLNNFLIKYALCENKRAWCGNVRIERRQDDDKGWRFGNTVCV